MKKIMVIANNSGGLFTFRGMLLKKLIEEKNEIIVLTPFSSNIEELKKIGVKLFETPINRRGINPITDFGLMKHYFSLIKSQKPDLIITYTIKPNIYGGIVSGLLKIPYAVNITGLGTAFQNKGLLKNLVIFLYKMALKSANVVFFENEGNLETIVNLKIVNRERCCLLNGAGVDLEKFTYSNYPNDNEGTRFLFIGRVMREKGIDELFSAMRMLKKDGINCTLDILGEYEEDYSEMIDSCAAEGWLIYHGHQMDVRPFIEKSHCFVLPSYHEGMANTNLECSSMGRPIITSNIHGCLEAVEDGKTGFLCESKNDISLYETMKKFALLPLDKKAEMGKMARNRMENIFDKRKVVEKTIKNLRFD